MNTSAHVASWSKQRMERTYTAIISYAIVLDASFIDCAESSSRSIAFTALMVSDANAVHNNTIFCKAMVTTVKMWSSQEEDKQLKNGENAYTQPERVATKFGMEPPFLPVFWAGEDVFSLAAFQDVHSLHEGAFHISTDIGGMIASTSRLWQCSCCVLGVDEHSWRRTIRPVCHELSETSASEVPVIIVQDASSRVAWARDGGDGVLATPFLQALWDAFYFLAHLLLDYGVHLW
jgi:hypothetical protein